jgi:hypothetical protein
MDNPICISTGCLRWVGADLDDKISMARNFEPDSIEVYLADLADVNQPVTPDNSAYFKQSMYRSIHAPSRRSTYDNSSVINMFLKRLTDFKYNLGVSNIVIHPSAIFDMSVIRAYDLNPSIENEDFRGKYSTPEALDEFFEKNADLNFTLDVAHALSLSDPLEIYVDLFKHRLNEIHFSVLKPGSKDHEFAHKHDSQELRDALACLKEYSHIPIVLEGAVPNIDELPLIQREMDFVRAL